MNKETPGNERSETIARVCQALMDGDRRSASQIIRSEYPFEPHETETRSYTKEKRLQIFIRDGFVDRYSGKRMLFPPVLGIVSKELPKDFPAHSNWKMSVSHYAYWELSPMIDHIVPIARGGTNEDGNLITSSALSNARKGNFTLEELEWQLHPPGDLNDWDGMLSWFLEYVDRHTSLLKERYPAGEIKSWYRAAVRATQRS